MSLQRDRRGVSDVLGFVLVFALIVASVGAVYAFGMTELEEVRDYERVNNAERAFDVFADNVGDVALRGAPSRGTELKLSDSSLEYAETTVNVSLDTTPDTSAVDANDSTGNRSLAPVRMSVADAGEIEYASGAVFRTDGDGPTRMVRDPDFVFDDDGVVIQLVRFDPAGPSKVGGRQIARIRTVSASRTPLLQRTETDGTLLFNVSSPHAAAWADYLESEGFDCTPDPETEDRVSCALDDVSRVSVVEVTMTTTFE